MEGGPLVCLGFGKRRVQRALEPGLAPSQRAEGVLEGNPLIDAVAAISVGVVGDRVLLDLCYEEDVQAQTDMNLVMTGSGGIVEVQATAEGRPFTRGEAEQMLDIGSKGIRDLLALQDAVLKDC